MTEAGIEKTSGEHSVCHGVVAIDIVFVHEAVIDMPDVEEIGMTPAAQVPLVEHDANLAEIAQCPENMFGALDACLWLKGAGDDGVVVAFKYASVAGTRPIAVN